MNHTDLSPLERISLTTFYALVTPGHLMPMWVGPPGGGKTECAWALGRALGVADENFLTWIAALHPPEDFDGWKVPRPEGLRSEPPYEIKRLCAAPSGVIFLDEASNAPRATQSAELRMIRERRCGETRIPDTVYMWGAMNPAESAADFHETTKPVANRLTWLPFPKVPPADHVAYMANFARPPRPLEFSKWTREAWDPFRIRAVQLYTAFMQNPIHQAMLYEDENAADVQQRNPFAWCTPRSVEAMVNYTATCLMFDDMAALPELVYGTVGKPMGGPWCSFALHEDLLDPELWLKDPALARWNHDRPDRAHAELQGMAMAACSAPAGARKKEKSERWNAGMECLGQALKVGVPREYAMMAGYYLGTHKPEGDYLERHEDLILEFTPMVRRTNAIVDAMPAGSAS